MLYLGPIHWAPLTQVPGQNFVHGGGQFTEVLTKFWKLALVIQVLLICITLGSFVFSKVNRRMIKTRLHGTVTLASLFCCHVLGALTLSRLGPSVRG